MSKQLEVNDKEGEKVKAEFVEKAKPLLETRNGVPQPVLTELVEAEVEFLDKKRKVLEERLGRRKRSIARTR